MSQRLECRGVEAICASPSQQFGVGPNKIRYRTGAIIMSMPSEDDHKVDNKNRDDAIAELVDAVLCERQKVPGARERVYHATRKLLTACKALEAVCNHTFTDLDESRAEVERRRQIGMTIDPATAETTFWWADVFDHYHILDKSHHGGQIGREQFARHPGASNNDWVDFNDLPEATHKALWERDEHKLLFPYGLHPDDDVINYPPAAQVKNTNVKDVSEPEGEIVLSASSVAPQT
jgi:hypothetical protein